MPTTGPSPVLVTGCSSGIGRATARRLAGNGHTVYATARNLEGLDDLTRAGCRLLTLDVTDETSMRDAVERVEAECGAVGSLVNNAGYSQGGAIEAVPIDRVRRQFETNVFGLVRLTQMVLPGMRRRHAGRIVNLSSMGGKLVFPGGGYYHATKYAVEAITDALRFAGHIDAPDDPAYSGFHAAVAEVTRRAYEGPLARLGAGPEAVAATIERGLTAARPRPRYVVSASARLLMAQRRLVTDRGWDRLMRLQFPRPR